MAGFDRRRFLKLTAGSAAAAGSLGWVGQAIAGGRIVPNEHDVLIVVDVQRCFIPGGSLAVEHGDEIVPLINRIATRFANVVLTQDWHTPDHVSFASQHPGKKPFETIHLSYGTQVLWPDHCVQGTEGAKFAPGLDIPKATLIIRKGYHPNVDSYSAFLEADKKTPTGLTGYLRERGMRRCFFAGLATDFCVAWSAMDARAAGFESYVIEDACRGINLGGTGLAEAWKEMTAKGVQRIQSDAIV
ncbi:MAG: bifunctional nicotinamidase/pyrazinamidase [Betaproteobacteria bacterium]|nr:bifunctional nicotinamidase/pyrazinamidase [Betaproteobacteria bacterium]